MTLTGRILVFKVRRRYQHEAERVSAVIQFSSACGSVHGEGIPGRSKQARVLLHI